MYGDRAEELVDLLSVFALERFPLLKVGVVEVVGHGAVYDGGAGRAGRVGGARKLTGRRITPPHRFRTLKGPLGGPFRRDTSRTDESMMRRRLRRVARQGAERTVHRPNPQRLPASPRPIA